MLSALIALTCFFSACDDTVLTNLNKYDPQRFNWRTVNLSPNFFNEIWAADTNNIFLMNNTSSALCKLSNGTFTNYPIGDYYLIQFGRTTKNVIFIFALTNAQELHFIKWDGTGFEYYPTGIVLEEYSGNIYRGCVINANEAWICSQNGIARYTDSGILQYRFEDTTMYPVDIFMSNEHKIEYICQKEIQGVRVQSLYEFRDTSFVKIFEYSGNIRLNMINGIKYGFETNQTDGSMCLYDFTGNSFVTNSCVNGDQNISFHKNPVGKTLDNLIFLVGSQALFGDYFFGIIHWNGRKVSREFALYQEPHIGEWNYNLFCIDERSFLLIDGVKLHIGTGQ